MNTGPLPADDACPFLGLAADPWSRFSFPDQGHRCHAAKKPVPIETPFQGEYCLAGKHRECPRYLNAERPLPAAGGTVAGIAAPAEPRDEGSVVPARTTTVTSTSRARRLSTPPSSRQPRIISRRTLPALLTLLAASVIGTALIVGVVTMGGTPSPTSPSGAAGVSPRSDPPALAPTGTPRPSPPLDPGPSQTPPVPTPTASPPAAPTPTASPPAAPTPTRTLSVPSPDVAIHVVSPGETLAQIAGLYGVRVRAIVRANDLEDPGFIFAGQRLTIPNPSVLPSEDLG